MKFTFKKTLSAIYTLISIWVLLIALKLLKCIHWKGSTSTVSRSHWRSKWKINCKGNIRIKIFRNSDNKCINLLFDRFLWCMCYKHTCTFTTCFVQEFFNWCEFIFVWYAPICELMLFWVFIRNIECFIMAWSRFCVEPNIRETKSCVEKGFVWWWWWCHQFRWFLALYCFRQSSSNCRWHVFGQSWRVNWTGERLIYWICCKRKNLNILHTIYTVYEKKIHVNLTNHVQTDRELPFPRIPKLPVITI